MLRAKTMTTSEALATLHNDLMYSRRTAIPGIVTGININGGTLISLDVQPAIFQIVTSEDNITTEPQSLPIIEGVPIVMPMSATTGFSLSVPVAVGDDVLLVCADRSIDNWQSTGKISSPAEPVMSRAHDLTDAIALIGLFNDKTGISNYNPNVIELRNKDGSISVSVSGSEVKLDNNDITATITGSEISLDNNGVTATLSGSEINLVNGSSSIKIESNKITIDSPLVEITGASLELASSSNVTTGGGLSSSGGLDFDNHVHSNPEGGNVGPPINP